jgi:hypothetical protein
VFFPIQLDVSPALLSFKRIFVCLISLSRRSCSVGGIKNSSLPSAVGDEVAWQIDDRPFVFFPWLPLSSGIYNHIRFRYIAPLSRAGYVISPFLTGDLSRMGVEEVPLVD